MYPHFIRLRGPWECFTDAGGPTIVKMPARWNEAPLATLHGPLRFVRKFGSPGQLDEGEFVWLTFRDFATPLEAWLNNERLGHATFLPPLAKGGPGPIEFPAPLARRNQLELRMQAAAPRDCIWGEVALEIRRSAWLAQTSVTIEGPDRWHISTTVKGSSPEPLELYVMDGGRQLHYQEIDPRPEGQPFAASYPLPMPSEVRVELVNLATVWYSVLVRRVD